MSIFIKGMEMPKNCSTCPCFQYNMFDDDIDGYCKALKTKITDSDKYHPNCQLTEVKTPHGRLGDLDELIEKYGEWYTEEGTESGYIGTMKNLLDGASTVIEAED